MAPAIKPQIRTCVVTGASSGIGLETARGLALKGHRIILVGRNRERTLQAAGYVRRVTRNDEVVTFVADFSSLREVRALAAELKAQCPAVHVLVNNAGLWHPKRKLSLDGIEDTLAVNHLAPFLLTNLLLDRIRDAAPARIVTVSSRLHRRTRRLDLDDLQFERRHYDGLSAYAQSKLANILFSNELARRLEGTGVTSNAVHPGDVATAIVRDSKLLTAGLSLGRFFLRTPEQGAETTLHVATAEHLANATGGYFADCAEAATSRLARDVALAGDLWNASARLTGMGR